MAEVKRHDPTSIVILRLYILRSSSYLTQTKSTQSNILYDQLIIRVLNVVPKTMWHSALLWLSRKNRTMIHKFFSFYASNLPKFTDTFNTSSNFKNRDTVDKSTKFCTCVLQMLIKHSGGGCPRYDPWVRVKSNISKWPLFNHENPRNVNQI